MAHRFVVLLAAGLVANAFTPRDARACSQPACYPARLTPGQGATVPANLPAIHWRPGTSFGTAAADVSMVTLATTADPTTPLAVTATALPAGDYLLVPNQALVAGTSYVITDGNDCGNDAGPTATFTAGPAAALPTQLGTLTTVNGAVAPLTVPTSSGSCTSEVSADQATFDLVLAADATPWLHALLFETLVDDVVWRYKAGVHVASWTGSNVDRIYHVCQTEDDGVSLGLDAGPHAVTMRASLPGSTTILTSTVAPATLQCGSVPPATCEADPSTCDEDEAAGCCSATNAPDGSWLLLALLAFARRRCR